MTVQLALGAIMRQLSALLESTVIVAPVVLLSESIVKLRLLIVLLSLFVTTTGIFVAMPAGYELGAVMLRLAMLPVSPPEFEEVEPDPLHPTTVDTISGINSLKYLLIIIRVNPKKLIF
jgi:hypothetical protein